MNAKNHKNEMRAILSQERRDIIARAQKEAWENILPIFILYLVDHFHCKQNGIQKFMDWFNAIDQWCGGDKERLKELLQEASERSNTKIEFCIGTDYKVY